MSLLRMAVISSLGLSLSAFASPSDPAGATPTRMIEVSAQVLARSQEASPQKVLMPLPFTRATDRAGRVFIADEKGRIDVQGAQGKIEIELDSPYFRVHSAKLGKPFSMIVDLSSGSGVTRAVFGDREAPLGARMCRAHLEQARLSVLRSLPPGLKTPPWFQAPVDCIVNSDEGCNAIWDGTQLSFSRGNQTCVPAAEVADLIYHEYGHGVTEALAGNAIISDIVLEGYADLLSAFHFGDPRFSLGLWRKRQISWIRDISGKKIFPQHYAGKYTASETFSSAWWHLRNALRQLAGEKRGSEIALRALLTSMAALKENLAGEPLVAAAQYSIEALERDAEAARLPGISCLARRVFSAHGLAALPKGCIELRLEVAEGDQALHLEVINEGQMVTPELRFEYEDARQSKEGGSLTPLKRKQRKAVKIAVEEAEGRGCAEPIEGRVRLWGLDGQYFEEVPTLRFSGQVGAPREVIVDLTVGRAQGGGVAVPDATAAGPGDWVELPFEVSLLPGERVIAAWFESATDHPYPDDLVFALADETGRPYEFYRGEEEIEVPQAIPLPQRLLPLFNQGAGYVLAQDLSKMIQGSFTHARVRLQVGVFDCAK